MERAPAISRTQQIQRVLQQRKVLKDNFQAKKLLDQGLYEQATKFQAPTMEAIEKLVPKTEEKIVSQPPPPPIISTVEDQEILSAIKNASPPARETNNTFKFVKDFNGVPLYSVGSANSNRQLFALHNTTLIDASGSHYEIPSVGVAKLLFETNPDGDVTKDDVDAYVAFLGKYSLAYTQPSKRAIIEQFYPLKTPRKLPAKQVAVKGEGLKKSIMIPSDTQRLYDELSINLAAAQAGNKNTFNYSNALMKELMGKNLLSGKDYRLILKSVYHL